MCAQSTRHSGSSTSRSQSERVSPVPYRGRSRATTPRAKCRSYWPNKLETTRETRVMNTAGRRALVMAALAIGLCWSRPASAQTDEEFFQTFPLNFSNPGARAQAMGGAFIAVADDASSAVTNPAGLANLTRQQAYFEYKGLNAPVAKLNT